jgi:DNA-binding NtrC family response regulator
MRKRIVVVDDDQSILDLVQHFLKGFNDKYEVITTTKSNEVPGLVAGFKTDILITDIRMPDTDGITLITDIHKKYPLLKIIAMSAGGVVSPNAYLNMAELTGSSYRLEKPFSKEALITAIKHVLSNND